MTASQQIPTTVREAWELACPKCGSDEEIEVAIDCWATLSPDGTESFGDHYWDQSSACRCGDCEHEATVADFPIDKRPARKSKPKPHGGR